jgi:hypothetical protein
LCGRVADDITSSESFANVSDWLSAVKDTYKGSALPLLALVGNKSECVNLSGLPIVRLA